MPEPARPIPVKLDVETLAALDALVAAGRQPTRSAAIRAGIELLLDAEHRRALDLGLDGGAGEAEARRDAPRPPARVARPSWAARPSRPPRSPSDARAGPRAAAGPRSARGRRGRRRGLGGRHPAGCRPRTPPQPSGPRPGLSVDW